MKRRFWIVLLIMIILILSYKVYSWNSDKNLMKETNRQLKFLLEPYINNTVVVIGEDKYFLRIKEVKLSDHVGPYKDALNDSAYVNFHVYKGKVSKDNLIDNRGIHIEVWRKDWESDFFIYGNGGRTEKSYKGEIFEELTYMIFSSLNENIIKSLSTEELKYGYSNVRSQGMFDEDNIKYNKYGEITSKGEVRYETITYAKDLSMKFTTAFYLEDFKQYQEMHVKLEKAEGDYHALWDIKKEYIETIMFHHRGNYKGKKVITNKATIEELVTYLKSIPFEQSEDQVSNYEPLIYVQLGDHEKDVTLSKDAIYTNSDHAVCKGENFVKEVIKILEKNNSNDMNDHEVNKRMIFSDTENMLYIENESLYLGHKNNSKILIKKNIYYDKMPQFDILYEDNRSKYIAVYYSNIHCGGPGQWIPFHIIRCDKKESNMEVVFEEENILSDCKFDNGKLKILIQDELEVIMDVDDVIENLSEYKKEAFLTGENIRVANTCLLEIKDFKDNGANQLMLRLWVKDYNLSLDLGYIYLILEVDDDKIKIIKGFEGDLNNEVINYIAKNTYYCPPKGNKDEEIHQLVNKGIVKEQDGRIQLFFEK